MVSTLNTVSTDMVIDDIGALAINNIELFACCCKIERI